MRISSCKYRAFDDVINEGAKPLVRCQIQSRQKREPGDRGDEWLVQAANVLDYMGIETGESEFDETTGVIEVNLEQLAKKVGFIRDNDYNVFFPIPFQSEVNPSFIVNPDVDFSLPVGDNPAHAECAGCGHYSRDGDDGTFIDGEFYCEECAEGEEESWRGKSIEDLRAGRHVRESAEPKTMPRAENPPAAPEAAPVPDDAASGGQIREARAQPRTAPRRGDRSLKDTGRAPFRNVATAGASARRSRLMEDIMGGERVELGETILDDTDFSKVSTDMMSAHVQRRLAVETVIRAWFKSEMDRSDTLRIAHGTPSFNAVAKKGYNRLSITVELGADSPFWTGRPPQGNNDDRIRNSLIEYLEKDGRTAGSHVSVHVPSASSSLSAVVEYPLAGSKVFESAQPMFPKAPAMSNARRALSRRIRIAMNESGPPPAPGKTGWMDDYRDWLKGRILKWFGEAGYDSAGSSNLDFVELTTNIPTDRKTYPRVAFTARIAVVAKTDGASMKDGLVGFVYDHIPSASVHVDSIRPSPGGEDGHVEMRARITAFHGTWMQTNESAVAAAEPDGGGMVPVRGLDSVPEGDGAQDRIMVRRRVGGRGGIRHRARAGRRHHRSLPAAGASEHDGIPDERGGVGFALRAEAPSE